MGCVYLAYNKTSHKVYIGKTMHTLPYRRKEHIYASNNGSSLPFYNAIRKYGINSFLWRTLFKSDNEQILNQMEILYIQKYKSKIPNGYNVANGGQGVIGVPCSEEMKKYLRRKTFEQFNDPIKKKKHKLAMKRWADSLTDEQRQQRSEDAKKNKGKPKPKGFGEQVRLRVMGNKNWLGKHHTEETKQIQSKKAIGRPKSELHKLHLHKASLLQFDDPVKRKNHQIATQKWANSFNYDNPEYKRKHREGLIKSWQKRKENGRKK